MHPILYYYFEYSPASCIGYEGISRRIAGLTGLHCVGLRKAWGAPSGLFLLP